jgi:hypothetical protein
MKDVYRVQLSRRTKQKDGWSSPAAFMLGRVADARLSRLAGQHEVHHFLRDDNDSCERVNCLT